MGNVIGIDLGTTNTCVSILDGGQAKILENSEGGRTTPSIVAFTNKGVRLVGQPAKRQMVTNAENTLLAIKRLMGCRYDDANIQNHKEQVSFDLVESSDGDAWVKVDQKEMSPAEVSAIVLQKMKQTAEQYLGEDVSQAVITVPAYFNDSQRQATRDAGQIAGLEVLRIVNEPTAAALAFGLDKNEGKTIAVYDLGGGTFDISILEVSNGIYQVKATNGDTYLGGVDFDQCVMNHIIEQFEKTQDIDLRQDRIAMQRIREAAENVRIELSNRQQADINLPFIHVDDEGPKHLSQNLSREKLESLVEHLIERTLKPCQTALQDAGIPIGTWTRPAVDEVILVGGLTRMPKVQQAVASLFGKEPHRGVNPDEVVAMGAAIQGGVLSGAIQDILLLDVTPFSLGIRTKGGGFSRLIEKNEPIPCKMTKTFTTARNWQSQVTVMVSQGEEPFFDNNKFLGKFILDGLPMVLRGTPRIEVTFAVDADGLVQVSAHDQESDRQQSMQVEVSGGLTAEDIQRLQEESKERAEEDIEERVLLESSSRAESLVYRASQLMAEHGAILEDALFENMETAIANLRHATESNEASDIINPFTDALQVCYDKVAHFVQEYLAQGAEVLQVSEHKQDVADEQATQAEESTPALSEDAQETNTEETVGATDTAAEAASNDEPIEEMANATSISDDIPDAGSTPEAFCSDAEMIEEMVNLASTAKAASNGADVSEDRLDTESALEDTNYDNETVDAILTETFPSTEDLMDDTTVIDALSDEITATIEIMDDDIFAEIASKDTTVDTAVTDDAIPLSDNTTIEQDGGSINLMDIELTENTGDGSDAVVTNLVEDVVNNATSENTANFEEDEALAMAS